ncbi:MAG TPA: hypothetical protein V6C69_18770 [Trichormus sp.]|jgi:hypothetical protein
MLHYGMDHLNWTRILLTELFFVTAVLAGLGYIKAPRWMMRRKLAKGFPWGYYADQIPKKDPGFTGNDDDEDFLHDTGTEFGGLEGFGDYGEFSGFGELGEFGEGFYGGDMGGGSFGGE